MVHLGAPCVSLGSFRGSFGRDLVVVGFGVFVRARRSVNLRAHHLVSLCSFQRVVGFIWERTLGHRVHSGSFGSFRRALMVLGLVR